MRERANRHLNRHAVTRIELIAALCVLCVAAWFIVPRRPDSGVAVRRAQCLSKLGQIGKAIDSYLRDHGSTWPHVAKLRTFKLHTPAWPTLPEALSSYASGQREIFHCPADSRKLSSDSPLLKDFPVESTWFETEGLSYEWMWGEGYGGKKVGEDFASSADGLGLGRADQPLLADFEPFHAGDEGGPFNTLYADLKARPARAGRK
ncbi:MAG: hypothetical protein ABII12_18565 [Planctomycetota bacterium]